MAIRQALLLEPVLTATLYEGEVLPLLLIFLHRVFHSRGEDQISTKTIFPLPTYTCPHHRGGKYKKAELVKR